ncbi:MAG: glycine--tRNA ligase [Bacilli bacterium]|nr:glycine--tRNA ligase [Bacilli bacterium]
MLTIDKITNLCKQYGFIFQGSEIYGGLANTWDYGPLGSKMKNNIKDFWRKRFIQERANSYEIDSSILMHPKVWEASGHVSNFNDLLVDCKECKSRYRVDNLISEHDSSIKVDLMSNEEMLEYINKNKVECPKCHKSNFTDIRQFNLLFQTYRGVLNDSKNLVYLRPENAQGEYINYLNVQRTMRCKIPFGIGQIGKAFRNEITPGNFIFRTIEFEQMEYQTFCKKGNDEEIYEYFKEYAKDFFVDLGINKEKLRFKNHDKLAFYAKAACDIEYLFPFGWGEINGTHNRTDYDLNQHQKISGQNMEYLDSDNNEKYIPYVVESTIGVDRAFLTLLCDSYEEETLQDGTKREVLKLKPFISPYKVAVFPLVKKEHKDKAYELYELLSKYFSCTYDDTANIGKKYRRQDVIGTPLCITVDENTIKDNTVTIRDRDSMKQEVVNTNDLIQYIENKIKI